MPLHGYIRGLLWLVADLLCVDEQRAYAAEADWLRGDLESAPGAILMPVALLIRDMWKQVPVCSLNCSLPRSDWQNRNHNWGDDLPVPPWWLLRLTRTGRP